MPIAVWLKRQFAAFIFKRFATGLYAALQIPVVLDDPSRIISFQRTGIALPANATRIVVPPNEKGDRIAFIVGVNGQILSAKA